MANLVISKLNSTCKLVFWQISNSQRPEIIQLGVGILKILYKLLLFHRCLLHLLILQVLRTWINWIFHRSRCKNSQISSMIKGIKIWSRLLLPPLTSLRSMRQVWIQLSFLVNHNLHSSLWITDTKATNHFVCGSSLFMHSSHVVNAFVYLPNGHKVQVDSIGTVQLNSHLVLNDVLCIPTFSFNLLSISKLVKSQNVYFIFLTDKYYIQNLSTWMIIGWARPWFQIALQQITKTGL